MEGESGPKVSLPPGRVADGKPVNIPVPDPSRRGGTKLGTVGRTRIADGSVQGVEAGQKSLAELSHQTTGPLARGVRFYPPLSSKKSSDLRSNGPACTPNRHRWTGREYQGARENSL